jgi:hypothetical protein
MTRNTDDTTTDRRRTEADDRREPAGGTMGGVSHTHPRTGETFGDSQVYQRGKVAVVDGGAAESEPDDDEREEKPMKDVDHTPREGAPAANEVYERGGEGTETAETAEDDDENSADPDVEEPV